MNDYFIVYVTNKNVSTLRYFYKIRNTQNDIFVRKAGIKYPGRITLL